MIVVDASVVAHMVFTGEETRAVTALHERDPEWAAPVLFTFDRRVLEGFPEVARLPVD